MKGGWHTAPRPQVPSKWTLQCLLPGNSETALCMGKFPSPDFSHLWIPACSFPTIFFFPPSFWTPICLSVYNLLSPLQSILWFSIIKHKASMSLFILTKCQQLSLAWATVTDSNAYGDQAGSMTKWGRQDWVGAHTCLVTANKCFSTPGYPCQVRIQAMWTGFLIFPGKPEIWLFAWIFLFVMLATNLKICQNSVWARENNLWPDMPWQLPVCTPGVENQLHASQPDMRGIAQSTTQPFLQGFMTWARTPENSPSIPRYTLHSSLPAHPVEECTLAPTCPAFLIIQPSLISRGCVPPLQVQGLWQLHNPSPGFSLYL